MTLSIRLLCCRVPCVGARDRTLAHSILIFVGPCRCHVSISTISAYLTLHSEKSSTLDPARSLVSVSHSSLSVSHTHTPTLHLTLHGLASAYLALPDGARGACRRPERGAGAGGAGWRSRSRSQTWQVCARCGVRRQELRPHDHVDARGACLPFTYI